MEEVAANEEQYWWAGDANRGKHEKEIELSWQQVLGFQSFSRLEASQVTLLILLSRNGLLYSKIIRGNKQSVSRKDNGNRYATP